MTPDHVNSLFEFTGGLFLLLNVMHLYRHKVVRGVHWVSVSFFSAWGYWNLYYYPAIEQWWSFAGAAGVAAANTAWLVLIIYYNWKERRGV